MLVRKIRTISCPNNAFLYLKILADNWLFIVLKTAHRRYTKLNQAQHAEQF